LEQIGIVSLRIYVVASGSFYEKEIGKGYNFNLFRWAKRIKRILEFNLFKKCESKSHGPKPYTHLVSN